MNMIQENTGAVAASVPTTTVSGSAMRLAKPSTTFASRSSDQDLLKIAGRIVAGMTANAAYPAPAPTLAVLTAAFNAFGNAVHANDRGSNAVAARNQARSQLVTALREMALYVQQASQGNLVTLLSSGFPVQRGRRAISLAAPAAPVGVQLRRGSVSGQVLGSCMTVEGVQMYEWHYANQAAPAVWTSTGTSTSRRVAVEGLVSTSVYLFQVRAYGRRGPGNWSENATIVVV
jgi:hypothetical protein